MPELGDKHTCADCQTKYYDLGRPDATCPKCGSANRVTAESAAVAARTPRAVPKAKKKPAEIPDELAEEEADELPDVLVEDVEDVELPEGLEDDEE